MQLIQSHRTFTRACFAAAMAACLLPNPLRAADDSNDDGDLTMGELCVLGGGEGADFADGSYYCCWDDWGCLECDADGYCEMKCESQRCCDANGDCHSIFFPEDDIPIDGGDGGGSRDLSDLALDVDLGLENTPGPAGPADTVLTEAASPEYMQSVLKEVAPPESKEPDDTEILVEQAAPACGVAVAGPAMFSALALFGMGRTRQFRRCVE